MEKFQFAAGHLLIVKHDINLILLNSPLHIFIYLIEASISVNYLLYLC